MISRLVLNLRSISYSSSTDTGGSSLVRGRDIEFRRPHVRNQSEGNALLTMTIGNLGEDFYQFSDP